MNKDSDHEDNEEYFNPEEEVGITGSDKVSDLPKEIVKSGEENEELIFKMRGRLYRWRDNEWKERGTGDIKLLRHKTEKRIRFVLRQDKTLKAVSNFMISDDPLCVLKSHQGSDKMFFFIAYDCSEEAPIVEKYVLKLGNADNAKTFKTAFEDAKAFNKASKSGGELKYAPVIVEEKEEEKKEEKTEDKKEEEKK